MCVVLWLLNVGGTLEKIHVKIKNASVCSFKTSPCAPAKRKRFECTHGGAFATEGERKNKNKNIKN